jgi:hypothetical protein
MPIKTVWYLTFFQIRDCMLLNSIINPIQVKVLEAILLQILMAMLLLVYLYHDREEVRANTT